MSLLYIEWIDLVPLKHKSAFIWQHMWLDYSQLVQKKWPSYVNKKQSILLHSQVVSFMLIHLEINDYDGVLWEAIWLLRTQRKKTKLPSFYVLQLVQSLINSNEINKNCLPRTQPSHRLVHWQKSFFFTFYSKKKSLKQ